MYNVRSWIWIHLGFCIDLLLQRLLQLRSKYLDTCSKAFVNYTNLRDSFELQSTYLDPFRVMDPCSKAFRYWGSQIRISSKCSYLNWVPNLYIITMNHPQTGLPEVSTHNHRNGNPDLSQHIYQINK